MKRCKYKIGDIVEVKYENKNIWLGRDEIPPYISVITDVSDGKYHIEPFYKTKGRCPICAWFEDEDIIRLIHRYNGK